MRRPSAWGTTLSPGGPSSDPPSSVLGWIVGALGDEAGSRSRSCSCRRASCWPASSSRASGPAGALSARRCPTRHRRPRRSTGWSSHQRRRRIASEEPTPRASCQGSALRSELRSALRSKLRSLVPTAAAPRTHPLRRASRREAVPRPRSGSRPRRQPKPPRREAAPTSRPRHQVRRSPRDPGRRRSPDPSAQATSASRRRGFRRRQDRSRHLALG
jgi:hypothetical protein